MTAPVPSLAASARMIAEGAVSSRDLVEASLARISAVDSTVHAFITVTEERARAAAEKADEELKRGHRRGPLHGVPVALKDNIDVEGVLTTAHSKILANNIAASSAGVTERLEAAGMIVVGKLSLHEFARGAPTDVLPWPNALNPWSSRHACGGSSSGSAVAVAAGMVPLAIGTDTGGSVRFPAACNGVVGLKPTYGAVSRRGVLPLSFSLDFVGPIARTVEDCALAMQAIAGHDPQDPGSASFTPQDYLAEIGSPLRGLKIGVAHDYNAESSVDAETAAAVAEAARCYAELGATVEEVKLPPRALFDAATWTIILAEGFAIHRQNLASRPEDYGRTARERLSIGALVTGGDLVQALRVRRRLTAELDTIIERYDAILCATASSPPVPLDKVDDGPWRRSHPITAPFNLTGHPAIAVPAGFSGDGLPLSIQLVGRFFDEARLFTIAHAYEQAHNWHTRRPSLP
ncbi:amidase [Chelativorans sp. Marseille-P2723]|uniref:amidase n=1 Tax=Chelativorans sp. Marseille-P2723 TaxID=2709133 RepID=UPI00156F9965|nr:amidase [Chelativorans sp. Marseille-P2723]